MFFVLAPPLEIRICVSFQNIFDLFLSQSDKWRCSIKQHPKFLCKKTHISALAREDVPKKRSIEALLVGESGLFLTLGSGTSSARNENQRPLFNRNIPLISGKYGLRNHFWPLESRFSHEEKWEKGPNFWGTVLGILRLTFLESPCNFRKFGLNKIGNFFG